MKHYAVSASALERPLARAVDAFHEYVELPDYSVVVFVCGVAVTASMPGDPTWGLVVAPPSTAKTEAVRGLDGVADARLDEVTPAGLLSWSRARRPVPVGILADHPGRCFATFGDLSTLLASSDRGMRDELFALLRRAHDGSVSRAHQHGVLKWEGRLTLLAAVTPSIDGYASHADALGPRWAYFRMPELSDDDRLAASRAARARSADIEKYRRLFRVEASGAVRAAVERLDSAKVSAELGARIDVAAQIASLGRAAIERSGYGKQEIVAMPVIEGPARLAIQLHQLARALDALGLVEHEVARMVQKVALDSMPRARLAALEVLASGEVLATAEAARRAGMNRGVARRALEELQAVGLTTFEGADKNNTEDEPSTPKFWRLDGPNAERISAVVESQECPEKGGNHPTLPTQSQLTSPPSSGHRLAGDES
jgi:hypothetical protein